MQNLLKIEVNTMMIQIKQKIYHKIINKIRNMMKNIVAMSKKVIQIKLMGLYKI